MKTWLLVAFQVVVLGWADLCCAGWLSHSPYSELTGFVPVDGYPTPLYAREGNIWEFAPAIRYTNAFYSESAGVQLAGGTIVSGSLRTYGGAVQLFPGVSTYDTDGSGYGGQVNILGGAVLYHYWDSVFGRDRWVTAYGPRIYLEAPGSVLTNAGPLGSVLHQGNIRILSGGLTLNGNAVLTTSNAAAGFMIVQGTQLVFVAGTVTNVIDGDVTTP